MSNQLTNLKSCGQSIWLDDLGRELIKSGMLNRLIAEDGVMGVTTNPTILQKALANDKIYDDELHYLVDKGESPIGL